MTENIKAALGISIFVAALCVFPLVMAMIPLVIVSGVFFHKKGYRVVQQEIVKVEILNQ